MILLPSLVIVVIVGTVTAAAAAATTAFGGNNDPSLGQGCKAMTAPIVEDRPNIVIVIVVVV